MTKRATFYNLVFIVLPLVIGVAIYRTSRAGQTIFESWMFKDSPDKEYKAFAGWAPDYLWCVSLLFLFSTIWKGWRKVPAYWWVALWTLVVSTELCQYYHIISGTADWYDVLAYQFAFVTFFILNHKVIK